MTYVKVKTQPDVFPFSSLLNNFVAGFPATDKSRFVAASDRHATSVNILETDAGFHLQVIAPGFAKEDFKIDLEKDLLTVSAQTKNEQEENKLTFIRREYKFSGFKRSFTLDQKIDIENISAEYINGILTLNLPKQAEVKLPVKQITVA